MPGHDLHLRLCNQSRYIPALDGIRGLAATLIVLYHARMPSLPGGFLAVDVFFVLSGFLITRLLLNSTDRDFSWSRFCLRRLRRLWPALLLFLLVYLLTAPLIFTEDSFSKHFRDALLTAGYVVNYASVYSDPLTLLGHVWTLAVEMQFYLVWPLVMLLIARVPPRMGLVILFGLFLLATASRWWQATPDDLWGFYVRTDARASGLILGAILAVLRIRIAEYWCWLGLLLLAFSMTFYSTQWVTSARYGFTLAEVGAALLIMSQPRWLGGPFWRWLAILSYSLYLWHYYFMKILQFHDFPWQAVLCIGGLGGLVAAWMSHRLVETRFYQPSTSRY